MGENPTREIQVWNYSLKPNANKTNCILYMKDDNKLGCLEKHKQIWPTV